MNYLKSKKPKLIIDCTHLGRNTTGIERITEELFNETALGTDSIYHVTSKNTWLLIIKQWFYITIKSILNPNAKVLTPGFPPSILLSLLRGNKVIPYIHDMFLLSRQNEINIRAKYYMRPSLSYAVKNLDYFFVNSNKTATELRSYCKPNANIMLYRPVINNVFNLDFDINRYQTVNLSKMKILMLGTVEPRKNYSGALDIFDQLRHSFGNNVELHVVGRLGWGNDSERLKETDGVICHGYLSSQDVKNLVQTCTFYLSTSHDEGLGLPLLELQYSGIAIVASDIPVFREVLLNSGLLIDPNKAHVSAEEIISFFSEQNLSDIAINSYNNVHIWNDKANKDRLKVIDFIHKK
jgi:glycosyltransferase involved in cell wall biosynthesis